MIAVPYALTNRRDWRGRLDIVALALPIPLLLAKVACFANGCCYGHESTWPWAVSMRTGAEAPAGIPRHPTELYEVLVALVILVTFALLDRERWKGSLILWFGMIYGVGRPLTEVFRGDGPRVPNFGPFTGSQATCLAGAAVSGIVLAVIRLRRAHRPPMIS